MMYKKLCMYVPVFHDETEKYFFRVRLFYSYENNSQILYMYIQCGMNE